MKKIIFGWLTIAFSIQAYSNEPIVKTGSIWIDQEYKIEVTFLPKIDEVKLISGNTMYTPEEYDCVYFRPAHCSTNIEFDMGKSQIRILLDDKEVFQEMMRVKGYSSLSRKPIDLNACDPTLPANQSYSVSSVDFLKTVAFTSNNKTIKLNILSNDGLQIQTIENQIQIPVSFNPTSLSGFITVGERTSRFTTQLHTEDEWVKIQGEAKNQSASDYSNRY